MTEIIYEKPVSPKYMYFTALEIDKLLTGRTGIDSDWSPDFYRLTFKKANQSIPIMLYNFLAWCLGFASDTVTDEKVK